MILNVTNAEYSGLLDPNCKPQCSVTNTKMLIQHHLSLLVKLLGGL